MKKPTFIQHLFEVKVKIFVFVALLLYVFLLFKATLAHFRTEDSIQDVSTIDFTLQNDARYIAAKVRTGLYIKNFPTFDFQNNKFVVDALVWFEFNKNDITLETIGKFSFENSTMIEKSLPPIVRVYGDKLLVLYNVVFETKTDLNFQRYPLEDHRISIVLTNDFVSPNEMFFYSPSDGSSLKISDDVFVSNWEVYNKRMSVGYGGSTFDVYNQDREARKPQAVFTIDFKKVGIKETLIIFIPLFASVFFALFAFLLSFNNYKGKFELAVSALAAILGYRFVIQEMMPSVGELTVTDELYLFFLFYTLAIFVFQVLLVRQYMFLMEQEKVKRKERAETDIVEYKPRQTEQINTIAYFIAVVIFVLVVTFIILK